MPRYIDADAFVQAEIERCGSQPVVGTCTMDNEYLSIRIAAAPTVTPDEVRGVVHCKDCKWCHAGYCDKYDDLIPWGCANKPWEDWFCADGKRREAIKEAQDAD